ncbi:hypothetical protein J7373_14395 [Xanthomonas sp. A2111]|uniref:Secreted protein n=1 Tax=Xanthomonas hawaiiensis TaxID=3003247 RepID=A0ABU2I6N5_9XANT|nr:hypothetical protein [Xanthomonas sp. A2111]MBO9829439.1 hypothetical protein [Xanthomonas sp. A2111]MDS9993799.1 hypothetical protein [Xanthomonas sp. A2111]
MSAYAAFGLAGAAVAAPALRRGRAFTASRTPIIRTRNHDMACALIPDAFWSARR